MPFSIDPETGRALIGAVGQASLVVGPLDTAIALGSGDIPVFGTPRMIALMEQAACDALVNYIGPELTSVGTDVQITHRRPSVVGASVIATATVFEVSGALVTFSLEVSDVDTDDPKHSLIGQGTHTRAVVIRDAFMHRLRGQ